MPALYNYNYNHLKLQGNDEQKTADLLAEDVPGTPPARSRRSETDRRCPRPKQASGGGVAERNRKVKQVRRSLSLVNAGGTRHTAHASTLSLAALTAVTTPPPIIPSTPQAQQGNQTPPPRTRSSRQLTLAPPPLPRLSGGPALPPRRSAGRIEPAAPPTSPPGDASRAPLPPFRVLIGAGFAFSWGLALWLRAAR